MHGFMSDIHWIGSSTIVVSREEVFGHFIRALSLMTVDYFAVKSHDFVGAMRIRLLFVQQ